ncbi:MAG: helix-turn-helix transcriptional regulator [Sulfolobales archaeon]
MEHQLALVLVLSALALVLHSATASAEGLVLLPLDSCGYEVATALVEMGLLDAVVVTPANVWTLDLSRTRVAILTVLSIAPEGLLELSGFLYASTDTPRVRAERTISAADLVAYCVNRDLDALARVAQVLKPQSSPPVLKIEAISLVVAVAVAATLTVGKELQVRFREPLRRVAATISTALSLLMAKTKLGYADLLNHPIRAAILEVLKTRGVADFGELMRYTKASRATLEWHLWVLKTRGLIVEVKSGRRRLYRVKP